MDLQRRPAWSLSFNAECAVAALFGANVRRSCRSPFLSEGYQLTQVAQRGDPDIEEKRSPLVRLVFGNLKTWLDGVHHAVLRQHFQAYYTDFTFRFDRGDQDCQLLNPTCPELLSHSNDQLLA